jgi:hypothetical protein
MAQSAGALLKKAHLDALLVGSRLSTHFRENHQPMVTDVKPEHVIELLHQYGV